MDETSTDRQAEADPLYPFIAPLELISDALINAPAFHPRTDGEAWSRVISPLELMVDALNRAAVFYPRIDEDGLPCIEVGGVLVFAYLDPDPLAVRISVHLDSLDWESLVPVVVDVEATTLMDARDPDSPVYHGASAALARLLDAADRFEAEAIRNAARACGLLWRCPNCRQDNHEHQARCGRCRMDRAKGRSE